MKLNDKKIKNMQLSIKIDDATNKLVDTQDSKFINEIIKLSKEWIENDKIIKEYESHEK